MVKRDNLGLFCNDWGKPTPHHALAVKGHIHILPARITLHTGAAFVVRFLVRPDEPRETNSLVFL